MYQAPNVQTASQAAAWWAGSISRRAWIRRIALLSAGVAVPLVSKVGFPIEAEACSTGCSDYYGTCTCTTEQTCGCSPCGNSCWCGTCICPCGPCCCCTFDCYDAYGNPGTCECEWTSTHITVCDDGSNSLDCMSC
jgi:hypothetical protein